MSRPKELAALCRVAGLIRDLRLTDLAQANAERQASVELLAGLEPMPAVGLDVIAEAQAAVRYQIWADQRRAEIEAVLQRQTKAVDDATNVARQAFGRAEVLRALSAKAR
jgi:hypothetical protein